MQINIPYVALLWVHLLCVVGTFGGLLAFQLVVPASLRREINVAGRASKVFNILLGIGLLAGILLYGMNRGHVMGPHYNGVIALKFVFLLATGALLGISKSSPRGDTLRKIAIVLMALAAFCGLTLS